MAAFETSRPAGAFGHAGLIGNIFVAALDTPRARNGNTAASGRISALLGNSLRRLSRWNDARITRKVLSRLSDRELDDIGLTRSDIDYVARS